jgi:4-amino-4-deoxy-L-arabinose transferase-like glycosyltransferase
MWLQAAAMALTGELRVAFRLPTLLSALGTLWLVRDLGARLWTREAGAASGWALLFAFQFTFQAQRAQIDPLLVFCTTLSLYGLLRHLLRGPDWRLWALGWFAAGLGVVAKGVGVVALLVLLPAVFAAWRGWTGLSPMAPGRARFWLGPAALLLPVLAWLVPMLWQVQSSGDPVLHAYADNLLFRQTATRYADPWHHHQPPWYFAGVVATQWLPVVAAVPFAWSGWRDALRARDARVLLPLAWIALVLLFFSASPGKREVYVLPALPALCLVLGPWLHGIAQRPGARWLALGATTLLAAVMLAAGAMVVSGAPSFEMRFAAERGIDAATTHALGLVLAAIGAWCVGCLLWFGRRQAVPGLLAALAGLWLLVGWGLAPVLNDASSSRGLMRDAGRAMGPDAALGLVGWKEQTLLMADRPATTWGFALPHETQLAKAIPWLRADPTRRILLPDTAMAPCIDPARAHRVGTANRRHWWLAGSDALVPGCMPEPAPGAREAGDGDG